MKRASGIGSTLKASGGGSSTCGVAVPGAIAAACAAAAAAAASVRCSCCRRCARRSAAAAEATTEVGSAAVLYLTPLVMGARPTEQPQTIADSHPAGSANFQLSMHARLRTIYSCVEISAPIQHTAVEYSKPTSFPGRRCGAACSAHAWGTCGL